MKAFRSLVIFTIVMSLVLSGCSSNQARALSKKDIPSIGLQASEVPEGYSKSYNFAPPPGQMLRSLYPDHIPSVVHDDMELYVDNSSLSTRDRYSSEIIIFHNVGESKTIYTEWRATLGGSTSSEIKSLGESSFLLTESGLYTNGLYLVWRYKEAVCTLFQYINKPDKPDEKAFISEAIKIQNRLAN
jgi:hypothetical protein